MKKISRCQECGRKIYTNDIELCKRCHQEVGVEMLREQEVFEEPEEEGHSLEDLDIESEETTEEAAPEKSPAEKVKEEAKE